MASILLAEDSPTHAALMRQILERDSHSVVDVADGKQALEAIAALHPDLVVTDLRMPEINGMELVSMISNLHPTLPSVVVTARGSESLAVDALAQGAANFVPKNSLGKLLLRVVRQTIQLARLDQVVDLSVDEASRHEWTTTLPSEPAGIEPAAWSVVQSLARMGKLDPTKRIRVGTAVASGLFNAICFGNLQIKDEDTIVERILSDDPTGIQDFRKRALENQYRNHSVTLKVSISNKDTRVSISHTGHGQATRMTPAPGTPESFEREQCRGLMLISSFMDDVILRGDATELVMVIHH